MCALYAASEGGDEATAMKDVQSCSASNRLPSVACILPRLVPIKQRAGGYLRLDCRIMGRHAQQFQEKDWCSATCNNDITYWGGAPTRRVCRSAKHATMVPRLRLGS